MTISYPLTMPTTPGFKSSHFSPTSNTTMNASPLTNTQQALGRSGDHWAGTLTLPPMKRASAAAWTAFFASLRGQFGTFYAYDPDARTPLLGSVPGTPLVNGASQTGTTLATKGWTHSVTVLKAGDYFQVGTQLFMNLTDATSDSSGNVTLNIYPNLRSSPADGATITATNPVGIFRLDTSAPSWDADQAGVYGFSFAIREAL